MRGNLQAKALVAAWFDFQPEPVRTLAESLQRIVRCAAPQLSETVKWGHLVYLLGGNALLAIAPHKAHVNLQVFNGAQLAAASWPLEGAGRGARHLRCRLSQPLDADLVARLVQASVALAERQGAARPPRPAPDAPGAGEG